MKCLVICSVWECGSLQNWWPHDAHMTQYALDKNNHTSITLLSLFLPWSQVYRQNGIILQKHAHFDLMPNEPFQRQAGLMPSSLRSLEQIQAVFRFIGSALGTSLCPHSDSALPFGWRMTCAPLQFIISWLFWCQFTDNMMINIYLCVATSWSKIKNTRKCQDAVSESGTGRVSHFRLSHCVFASGWRSEA